MITTRLLRELRPQRARLAVAVAAALTQTAAAVALPLAVRHGIDQGVLRHDRGPVGVAFAAAVGLAGLQLLARTMEMAVMTRVAERHLAELRCRLAAKLHRLDAATIDAVHPGSVIARMTADVLAIQPLLATGLGLFAQSGLLLALTAVAMITVDLEYAAVVLVVVIPLVVEQLWFRRRTYAAQVAVRSHTSDLIGHLADAFSGAAVIRAYSLERHLGRGYEETTGNRFAAKREVGSISARHLGFLELMQPLTLALVIGAGALLAERGRIEIGAIVAFSLYGARIFQPIQQVAELSSQLQAARAAYDHIDTFLDLAPSVREMTGAAPLDDGPGRVELVGAAMTYPDGTIGLRPTSLVIPAGQRVSIIGPSGAGKSTLAKLLVRFHDQTEGTVLLDGADTRTVTLASLRRAVLLVPQDVHLFAGTVASNLLLVLPGADRTVLERELTVAGALGWMSSLPVGLDTEVLERGRNLSAGQRQIVCIARALLAGGRVLVLDEVTGRIDPATEAALDASMSDGLRGRTAIIVTHRASTARRADRVIVLEDGKVVADGAPSELDDLEVLMSAWATDADDS